MRNNAMDNPSDPEEWIDRNEYPFDRNYFQLEEGRLHYVDVGEGPPMVLVHGNPTWSFLYRHIIKYFRSNHRCIAPDHLGFGLSDKPRGWSYLPAAHAHNLELLIDHLGLSEITLVVQDWGGPIGLSYAIQYPDLIRRIVIMNTWLWPVHAIPHFTRFSGLFGSAVGKFLVRNLNIFARVVLPQSYGDKAKLTKAIHQHYLRPLNQPEKRVPSAIFPQQIVGATPWLAQLWESREAISRIPMLIVWGMKDIGFREQELNTWLAHFPHAQCVRLEDVGHYVQEEAPAELNQSIEAFIEAER